MRLWKSVSWAAAVTVYLSGAALAEGQQSPGAVLSTVPSAVSPAITDALGLSPALAQLQAFAQSGEAGSPTSLALRQEVLERVLLASFDVDETLGRIDAEAAHANDIRYLLVAEKQRRDAAFNLATFAVGGALATAGAAMQLTRGLDHAGNAVSTAGGGAALTLSALQLKGGQEKRVFRSPYNMLAEILGQQPNSESRYPALIHAYLHAPTSGDGQIPDEQPPEISLVDAWHRLKRLQQGTGKGASLQAVTSDPAQGLRLTGDELADREAMLRDLHGAVSLLKVELRDLLRSVPAMPLNPTR